jgi:hypothetical protein
MVWYGMVKDNKHTHNCAVLYAVVYARPTSDLGLEGIGLLLKGVDIGIEACASQHTNIHACHRQYDSHNIYCMKAL